MLNVQNRKSYILIILDPLHNILPESRVESK